MVENQSLCNSNYDEQGYLVIRNFFSAAEISSLRKVILKFHDLWKRDNAEFYQEEAFNSSLITGTKYLAFNDRIELFNFIGSNKIINVIESVMPANPSFMNTQLFFDPQNREQNNFWHRDCQNDYDEEDQKKAIEAKEEAKNEIKKIP